MTPSAPVRPAPLALVPAQRQAEALALVSVLTPEQLAASWRDYRLATLREQACRSRSPLRRARLRCELRRPTWPQR